MNLANKKTDQGLSDFQTGIGAAFHATLGTNQLMSGIRTALVDMLALVQDLHGGVIAASEVHELCIKIYDILDNAVSKQVGDTAHILVYLFFNSASRSHFEVWASQFPFFTALRIPFLLVALAYMVTSSGL